MEINKYLELSKKLAKYAKLVKINPNIINRILFNYYNNKLVRIDRSIPIYRPYCLRGNYPIKKAVY